MTETYLSGKERKRPPCRLINGRSSGSPREYVVDLLTEPHGLSGNKYSSSIRPVNEEMVTDRAPGNKFEELPGRCPRCCSLSSGFVQLVEGPLETGSKETQN